MDELLLSLAKSSPTTVVAIYAIWKMSTVTAKLTSALVTISTGQLELVEELVEGKLAEKA